MDEVLIDKVKKISEEKFGSRESVTVSAPGRINLMGEHTDYNLGFVLPAAINYYIHASFTKNQSDQCNIYSMDFDEGVSFSLSAISESETQWLNFVLGVTDQLKDKIEGFDMVFTGNIPRGAGLSSSAALCCSVVFGLSHLFDLRMEKWEMAKVAQKAEHDFAHVNCGIMDQFACLFGLTNHALTLNCLTLEYQVALFDMEGYRFVLFNSNVPHDLQESAYNARRMESQQAIDYIKANEDDVASYQDVDMKKLEKYEGQMNSVAYRRARHIVTENQRVHQISRALSARSFEEAGQLLTASHQSEKNDYEITCAQTDFLVDEFIKEEQVMGARQVGGGFGGCILGIARDKNISSVLTKLNQRYKNEFGLTITNIPIRISKGCHLFKNIIGE